MIALLLASLLALGVDDVGDEAIDDSSFIVTRFSVAGSGTRVALRDMNGDGRLDLVRIDVRGVGVRFMDEDGRFPEDVERMMPWPTRKVGWDLADLDGDGQVELVMYIDGRTVMAWHPGDGPEGRLVTLLDDVPGILPEGIRRMPFVRDIDGDSRGDLILPAPHRFLIYLSGEAERSTTPIEITYQASIRLQVGDPDSVNGEFGQSFTIPLFTIMDIDGDGNSDLISETRDELAVFLARPELPTEADWTLDLASMRTELETESPQGINLEDLAQNIPPSVDWKTADIDGVAPLDLVLQRGNRFTVYLGGSHGPDIAAPDQVLKASGNVLHFLVRDVDGNGRADLQLVRVESISLGTVLRWLVIAGSLDFDVFTYGNDGEVFSRRPTERQKISVHIPALIGFISDIEEMEDEVDKKFRWPARHGDFDGDGVADDVVDLPTPGKVAIYFNVVPEDFLSLDDQIRGKNVEEIFEKAFLQRLDIKDKGEAIVVDLANIDDLIPMPGWSLHQAARKTDPVATWDRPKGHVVDELLVHDLNADGRDDVVVVLKHELRDDYLVVFLVQGPADFH